MIGLGLVGVVWVATGQSSRSTRFSVPEVDVAKAKALLDAGALAVDVRGQDPFDYRHLPGAMLIPLVALRTSIPLALSQAKERQIVVYCNDGHSSGPEATDILVRNGFKYVQNLKSGVEGWASAGLPLVKAANA
ncbi:rhodanese-like domain-containing protein [Ramlibacter ginsenosidimutans]|uniref:rhodanese-like domain-containing protein n=1 Tax=Ramlibacter ginsenosidimutans TaxID=502333 RepID=UPI0030F3A9FB